MILFYALLALTTISCTEQKTEQQPKKAPVETKEKSEKATGQEKARTTVENEADDTDIFGIPLDNSDDSDLRLIQQLEHPHEKKS